MKKDQRYSESFIFVTKYRNQTFLASFLKAFEISSCKTLVLATCEIFSVLARSFKYFQDSSFSRKSKKMLQDPGYFGKIKRKIAFAR